MMRAKVFLYGQSTPVPLDSNGLWIVIGGVCLMVFLAAGIIGIMNGWRRLRERPEEWARREEMSQVVRRLEALETKRESDMGEIRTLIKVVMDKVDNYAERSYLARKEIHKEINGHGRELSGLQARVEDLEGRREAGKSLAKEGAV